MEKQNEFIELINPWQPLIYKVCLAYCKNKDDLCDLFQEALLNLWTAYPRYKGEGKLSTWIYRVTLNTCISDLRKKKKIEFLPIHDALRVYEENGNEKIKELYSLIHKLNPIERALILLWLDEKSYEEISDILQMTKSNVSVKLVRIKEKLKQMYNFNQQNYGTK